MRDKETMIALMRRSWAVITALALMFALAAIDPAAATNKTRSKGASSRSSIKRAAKRGKSRSVDSRRGKRGRNEVAVRGRRGRRLGRRSQRRRSEPQIVMAGTPRAAPGIPTERVAEIQTALIKAGYMDGPATGLYDDATIEAMKEFQAKNGLSQTGLPSAHLLKKLGVSKRSNDGYALPVNRVSETDKKKPEAKQP